MKTNLLGLSLPKKREIGTLIMGIGLGPMTPLSFRYLDSSDWMLVGILCSLVGIVLAGAPKKDVDVAHAKEDGQPQN